MTWSTECVELCCDHVECSHWVEFHNSLLATYSLSEAGVLWKKPLLLPNTKSGKLDLNKGAQLTANPWKKTEKNF